MPYYESSYISLGSIFDSNQEYQFYVRINIVNYLILIDHKVVFSYLIYLVHTKILQVSGVVCACVQGIANRIL